MASKVLDLPLRKLGTQILVSPLKGINLARANLKGIFHIQEGLFTNQGKIIISLKLKLERAKFKDFSVKGCLCVGSS